MLMAINERGDVVVFAGDPALLEGDILHQLSCGPERMVSTLKPLLN